MRDHGCFGSVGSWGSRRNERLLEEVIWKE